MTTSSFISEYNGSNPFLNSVKNGYAKYGRLTSAQVIAVDKIRNGMKEKVKSMAPIEVRENIKQIMDYKGTNKFISDLQSKYDKYGRLTEKQIDAGLMAINRKVQNKMVEPMTLTGKNTIRIRQYIARQIKEEKDLKFLPIQVDVTHLIGASRKAIHLRGKLSTVVGVECRCCGRALSDKLSMASGMGKTCATNTGLKYLKDESDVVRFNVDLAKRVEEIGSFDFWIPKSQVQEWEGLYSIVLKSQFKTYVTQ